MKIYENNLEPNSVQTPIGWWLVRDSTKHIFVHGEYHDPWPGNPYQLTYVVPLHCLVENRFPRSWIVVIPKVFFFCCQGTKKKSTCAEQKNEENRPWQLPIRHLKGCANKNQIVYQVIVSTFNWTYENNSTSLYRLQMKNSTSSIKMN